MAIKTRLDRAAVTALLIADVVQPGRGAKVVGLHHLFDVTITQRPKQVNPMGDRRHAAVPSLKREGFTEREDHGRLRAGQRHMAAKLVGCGMNKRADRS